ncbi:hypothetical protein ACIQVL_03360 [Streptomyces sp. NPDC090499]|uniref:hypothetical protein n=1 Tax=Streptomyces sp. NPDC090499 TaxID=3365965 RepID=UPI003811A76D
MVELLISLAKFIALLIFMYVALVVWDVSAPPLRRLRRRAVLVLRRAIGPTRLSWQEWVTGRALQRVQNAVMHMELVVPGAPRTPGPLTREWCGVVEAVKAWCRFAPWAFVVHATKLFVLVVALFNVGTIVAGVRYLVDHPPVSQTPTQPDCLRADHAVVHLNGPAADAIKACRGPVLDPLATVWGWGRDAVGWLRETADAAMTGPGTDPVRTATVLIIVVLLVMFTKVMLRAAPFLRRVNDAEENGRRSDIRDARERVPRSVQGGETARWQPVVVLLVVCGSLGRAYKRLEPGDVLYAPRVSLKAAERAVWSAWRTRHGSVRRDRRGELKEHAAKVVGALRAMEARQDTAADTGKVFEDTAAMLLKIAQRYAAGRTLELLDTEDLEDVTPVVSREWLRLVALGVIVTGTVVGATAVGMPDGAATPLIGVVSVAAWGVLYGGRMVGTELVDVMRGQSRG